MRIAVDIHGPARRWSSTIVARLTARLQARRTATQWQRLARRGDGTDDALDTGTKNLNIAASDEAESAE